MKDEAKTLDQIAAEVKQDLNDKVDLWMKSFSEKTGDLAKFPTIDQIEESLTTLDAETQKIYLNTVIDVSAHMNEDQVAEAETAG